MTAIFINPFCSVFIMKKFLWPLQNMVRAILRIHRNSGFHKWKEEGTGQEVFAQKAAWIESNRPPLAKA
jgi:hypothetical protein